MLIVYFCSLIILVLKNRLLVSFLVAASLLSCSDSVPNGILEKKQMVTVLINIHLAEAKANNSFLNSDTLKIFYQSLEDTLFIRYNTDKNTFEKSFQYYMGTPSVMEKIYAQVVDSLSLREAIKNID